MKNKERAQLEAQHQKELESFKKEVVRFTGLLKQALESKFREAIFTTQPLQMPTTPFNPQNLQANEMPLEFQHVMYF